MSLAPDKELTKMEFVTVAPDFFAIAQNWAQANPMLTVIVGAVLCGMFVKAID